MEYKHALSRKQATALVLSILTLLALRGQGVRIFPTISMPDGPNYEQVFTRMQVFHGKNPEDVKHIVRYLRFFRGQDGYELYAKHYIPMLSPEIAAEFLVEYTPKTEQKEEVVQDSAVETINVVTEAPKKKPGRPKKIK